MSIEWFNVKKGIETVTIAEYGIVLNEAAYSNFLNASKIKLGYDKKYKRIYIKPCDVDDDYGISITNNTKITKNLRISCSDFIKFISINYKINFNTSKRYSAIWDGVNEMLVVYLEKEIKKSKHEEESNK